MSGDLSEQQLLGRAKLAEQCERYDDMKDAMKKVVEIKKVLKDDERNLLSVAYKNVVGSRRASWRIMSAQEAKADNDAHRKASESYRLQIEKELNEICDEVIKLLGDHLISSDGSSESTVFYQKMKGDYYRYKVEVQTNADQRTELAEKSKDAYNKAFETAKEKMPALNPIRLGLALNFSVFYYEIMNNPETACNFAKEAFDVALAELTSMQEGGQDGQHEHKDSMLIMQLLRDNLALWTSENDADDDQQQEN